MKYNVLSRFTVVAICVLLNTTDNANCREAFEAEYTTNDNELCLFSNEPLQLPFPQKEERYHLYSDDFLRSSIRLYTYPIMVRAMQGDTLMQSLAGIIKLCQDNVLKATYWFERAAEQDDEFSKQALEILAVCPQDSFDDAYLSFPTMNKLHQCCKDVGIDHSLVIIDWDDFYNTYIDLPQVVLAASFLCKEKWSDNMSSQFDLGPYDKHIFRDMLSVLLDIFSESFTQDPVGMAFDFKRLLEEGVDEGLFGIGALYSVFGSLEKHFSELYREAKSKTDNPILQGLSSCVFLAMDKHKQALKLMRSAWRQYQFILEVFDISMPEKAYLFEAEENDSDEVCTLKAACFFYELFYHEQFYPMLYIMPFSQMQNALELYLIANETDQNVATYALEKRNDRTQKLEAAYKADMERHKSELYAYMNARSCDAFENYNDCNGWNAMMVDL